MNTGKVLCLFLLAALYTGFTYAQENTSLGEPGVETSAWDFAPAINESERLFKTGLRKLPGLAIGLLILFCTFLLTRHLSSLANKLLQSRIQTAMLRRLVARLITIPFFILAIFITLNITGLGSLAATVIGGTGLLGLIIGIAFRDITENFLASILISIQRPFRIGDTIKILEYLGMVQAVNTRGTVLMTLEGNHVQIPNSIIYKEPIINFTANPKVRLDFTVGIGYEDSIATAQHIAMRVLQEHPAVLNDPEPLVLAEQLASSTINLRIYFWVNGRTHSVLKVKSAVIRLIKYTFTEKGVSMPDDSREVIFPHGIQVYMADGEKAVATTLENKTPAQHKPQKKMRLQATEEQKVSTESEGDLKNDMDELKNQAQQSTLSENESNLLTDQFSPQTH